MPLGAFAHRLLADTPFEPTGVMAICAIAGLGTYFLLPSARPAPSRRLGAVVLAIAGAILAAFLIRWATGSAADAVVQHAENPAAGVTGIAGTYFWIFSIIAIVAAVRVVTHTRPVYSALYFVLTVFATAGLFLLLQAEFIAAALVLIYAGAILITYVFVIMLAAEAAPAESGALARLADHDRISREPFLATLVGFTMMGLILYVIFDRYQMRPGAITDTPTPGEGIIPASLTGSTQQLGAYLFENQIISLELAGLLLTIAMVGAIIIARRRVASTRTLDMTPEELAIDADFAGELVLGPATPVNDSPDSIPVIGTKNPRQKAYPET